MAERIAPGERRVAFRVRHDAPPRPVPPDAAEALCGLVRRMIEAELCPVMEDHAYAGNASIRPDDTDALLVTRSARRVEDPTGPASLTWVERFDPESWTASVPADASGEPSSDTPLHWLALIDAPRELGFGATPRVALHGHALEDPALAAALGIPCGPEETQFSTPADREALRELLRAHPYPGTRVWVRRGHGFFLLADDVEGARLALEELIARYQALGST